MVTIKRVWLVAIGCLIIAAASGWAQGRGGANASPVDVGGAWTGSWSAYNPAQGATPPKEQCARLDANVVEKDGGWVATFEGDCGRPYKYTITMEGRQVGPAVLFKGTVDLGPKDGGVYDWVGRATKAEFVGFYTSAYSTGTFSLTRAK